MKAIQITRDMAARLLKAVRIGELNPDQFPELFDTTPPNVELFTPAERDARIEILKKKLLESE
jgi:hypothetical protein